MYVDISGKTHAGIPSNNWLRRSWAYLKGYKLVPDDDFKSDRPSYKEVDRTIIYDNDKNIPIWHRWSGPRRLWAFIGGYAFADRPLDLELRTKKPEDNIPLEYRKIYVYMVDDGTGNKIPHWKVNLDKDKNSKDQIKTGPFNPSNTPKVILDALNIKLKESPPSSLSQREAAWIINKIAAQPDIRELIENQPDVQRLEKSDFKVIRVDDFERSTDWASVGGNASATFFTSLLGALPQAGVDELKILSFTAVGLTVMLTQGFIRFAFSALEFANAPNQNLNRYQKLIVNTAIFLAAITGFVLLLGFSGTYAAYIPFLFVGAASARTLQGLIFGIGNAILWAIYRNDPIECERYRTQTIKRFAQFFAAGAALTVSALALAGYTVSAQVLAPLFWTATVSTICVMFYSAMREYEPFKEFFLFRKGSWVTTYNEPTSMSQKLWNFTAKNILQWGFSNTITHLNTMRTETFEVKSQRLLKEEVVPVEIIHAEAVEQSILTRLKSSVYNFFDKYILPTPAKPTEFNHTKGLNFELEAIFHRDLKKTDDDKPTLEAKGELAKKFLTTIIKEQMEKERYALAKYALNNQKATLSKDEKRNIDKYYFLKCLLKCIDSTQQHSPEISDRKNPFAEVNDFYEIEDILKNSNNRTLHSNVFKTFLHKMSNTEALYRAARIYFDNTDILLPVAEAEIARQSEIPLADASVSKSLSASENQETLVPIAKILVTAAADRIETPSPTERKHFNIPIIFPGQESAFSRNSGDAKKSPKFIHTSVNRSLAQCPRGSFDDFNTRYSNSSPTRSVTSDATTRDGITPENIGTKKPNNKFFPASYSSNHLLFPHLDVHPGGRSQSR